RLVSMVVLQRTATFPESGAGRIEPEFLRWTIVNLQSVCFQACRPKLLANALNNFGRRRLSIFEGVIETELLPFVATHLMKRQYIYAFDISQSCHKAGE